MSADMALLTQACLPLLGNAEFAAAIKRAQLAGRDSTAAPSIVNLVDESADSCVPADVTEVRPDKHTDAIAEERPDAIAEARPDEHASATSDETTETTDNPVESVPTKILQKRGKSRRV